VSAGYLAVDGLILTVAAVLAGVFAPWWFRVIEGHPPKEGTFLREHWNRFTQLTKYFVLICRVAAVCSVALAAVQFSRAALALL
jgi:hypothetical protein